jgi:hypothetical protein
MRPCPFCASEIPVAAYVCPHCTHVVVDRPDRGPLTAVLVILSILFAVFGVLNLSSATLGVGILVMACWFAILARLAQADAHRRLEKVLVRVMRTKAIEEKLERRATPITEAGTERS